MNISKNKLSHIIFIFITLASLTIMISCSSEEEIVVPKEKNEQTVIMFFPWSSNLLPYFQQNIKDFSKSIEERGSQNARVMICLATTPNTADLMELKYDNGSCIVENIRTYDNQRFTSQEGIYIEGYKRICAWKEIWINYWLPWNGMVASNSYKIQ